MADFSSLKQTIQSYIKQNGNEEITGNILQDVLLAMVSTMGDSAINSLASALQDEITARQNQDGTLQGNITAEATARQQADTALGGRIDGLQTAINGINTKLAEGYIYAGIATPSTNPGTPSGKVFYIAVSSGTYTNFSNITAAQGINILKYNGSAWSKDVVYAIDTRPKKNSQNPVTSGGVFDNIGALDVSELNATENPHTLAQYADLSAALAAIPTDYQKGGMSVKFVQSSDNKYVQYRLVADEWSADTADWTIAEEGSYVENLEYIYVKTDSEGKILWAIKTDGSIYYGAGVPQQVIDYINEKITELSLDEYEDIVAFLADLEKGDKTLQDLLDKKVDGEYVENPEFISVDVDAENKVLEGIQKDGTKIIGGDLKVLGKMEVSGVSYKVIENPEYLAAWVDAEDKVIFGFKADGKTYIGDADFLDDVENIKAFLSNFNDKNIDWDALTSFNAIENPEFIDVELDADDKILGGRKTDGTKFENNDVELNGNATVGGSFEVDGVVIKNIEDPEWRLEIATDSEDKIISYRKDDGTLVENIGIESPKITTDSLNLSDSGMTEFQQALKDAGFQPGGAGDWSDYISEDGNKPLTISEPRCAVANIHLDMDLYNLTKNGQSGAVEGVNYDVPAVFEFYDMQGNYFKKNIIISAQGRTSLKFPKHNFSIDMFDEEVGGDAFKVKFGSWVAQDSFHLKGYWSDAFRGLDVVGYKLYQEMRKTKSPISDKPFKYLFVDNYQDNIKGGSGKVSEGFDNNALCTPMGFPVILYHNGDFYGVYAFQIKKHRDNYYMKKSSSEQIHIDLEDGNLIAGNLVWNSEIRNPKNLVYAEAHNNRETNVPTYKYDGDNPGSFEIAGNADGSMQYDTWVSGSYPVNKIVEHNNHYYLNTVADNMAEPVYDKKNNGDDAPDFKNKTGCGWLNVTNTVKVKRYVIEFVNNVITLKSMVTEGRPREEIRDYISAHFSVDFIIDYNILNEVIQNRDAFGGNGQWTTWDAGQMWNPNPYDLNASFGYDPHGLITVTPYEHLLGTGATLYGRIYAYFRDELEARYKELRDKGIITADNIYKYLHEWIECIGINNIEAEFAQWDNTISFRDSYCNNDNWVIASNYIWQTWSADATYRLGDYRIYNGHYYMSLIANNIGNNPASSPTAWEMVDYDSLKQYNVGDKAVCGKIAFECTASCQGIPPVTQLYDCYYNTYGYYDSEYRVYGWITSRIKALDNLFNY